MKGSAELEERLDTLRWVIDLCKLHPTSFDISQKLKQREEELVHVLERTSKK